MYTLNFMSGLWATRKPAFSGLEDHRTLSSRSMRSATGVIDDALPGHCRNTNSANNQIAGIQTSRLRLVALSRLCSTSFQFRSWRSSLILCFLDSFDNSVLGLLASMGGVAGGGGVGWATVHTFLRSMRTDAIIRLCRYFSCWVKRHIVRGQRLRPSLDHLKIQLAHTSGFRRSSVRAASYGFYGDLLV